MIAVITAKEAEVRLGPDCSRAAIIEAWIPGCGACHQVDRVLALLSEHHEQIDFYRLELSCPETEGVRLGVAETPTVILWHEGREQGRLVGAAACDAGCLSSLVANVVTSLGRMATDCNS